MYCVHIFYTSRYVEFRTKNSIVSHLSTGSVYTRGHNVINHFSVVYFHFFANKRFIIEFTFSMTYAEIIRLSRLRVDDGSITNGRQVIPHRRMRIANRYRLFRAHLDIISRLYEDQWKKCVKSRITADDLFAALRSLGFSSVKSYEAGVTRVQRIFPFSLGVRNGIRDDGNFDVILMAIFETDNTPRPLRLASRIISV